MTDVTHQLAGQILDRGEDPARNDLARDPREPVFDLIEPGGVGWRVVQVQLGVSCKELLNPRGFVGREMAGNEMNLLAARLLGGQAGEEGYKLLLVWRAAVLPTTSPLRVLSAA